MGLYLGYHCVVLMKQYQNMRINNAKSGIINSGDQIKKLDNHISKLEYQKQLFNNNLAQYKSELEKMTAN